MSSFQELLALRQKKLAGKYSSPVSMALADTPEGGAGFIIITTRPKPPSGRQGLVGSWGKDTVRQVHYKMFSTSHFAPTPLSSNWILLFECGYKNSLVITKIFYFLLSTFYFLSEDKPL